MPVTADGMGLNQVAGKKLKKASLFLNKYLLNK